MSATLTGRLDVISLLMEGGANVNATNKVRLSDKSMGPPGPRFTLICSSIFPVGWWQAGETALIILMGVEFDEAVLQYLLLRGADLSIQDTVRLG
jgi:hypothetical protein